MSISDDEEDALEAQRDYIVSKKAMGTLFRRPPSPKNFESSLPFSSSPAPMNNPFVLEDIEVFKTLPSPPIVSPLLSTWTTTAHGRTSNGQSVRIGKRKRKQYEDLPEAYYDADHASKTKHYGIEIHTLLSDLDHTPRAPFVHDENVDPQSGMWVDKYRPRKFTELLGDERTNRDIMRWIKQWDYCVFGQKSTNKKKSEVENTDPYDRPHRRILMLTGPPGLGKTTLAHMAAKQAGYQVLEINASDDRTGSVVQNKIADALESQAVFNPRPSLVVIDEIDGVSGSGGDAGFIRSLLKFVTEDEKTSGQLNKLSTDDKSRRRGKKKSKTKLLLRPIICICNDQYVPALRPLRQYCQIINFRALNAATVVGRLRNICQTEGLQADIRALNALCELSESDLRSCVNSLQYIRMKSKNFTLESLSSTLARRDTACSSHSVVEAVFKLRTAKAERKKVISSQDSVTTMADLAMTNNEYGKILNGCFAHYPNAPYHDSLFSKPSQAADWLHFYDRCERGVYEHQQGELVAYMPYPIAAFHHLFATHSATSPERSKVDYEVRERTRINAELSQTWINSIRPSLRQLFNPGSFNTELISYTLRIISTDIAPSNAQLIKPRDKEIISRVVDAMRAMGLQYIQFKVDDGSYIYRLEPDIIQLLDFPGIKGESLLPKRYATRALIAGTMTREKIVEESTCIPTKRKPEVALEAPRNRDFFGRERGEKSISTGVVQKKAGVYVTFKDGYSDAVRNSISIMEILGSSMR